MIFYIVLVTILILNVTINARVIDTNIDTDNAIVSKTLINTEKITPIPQIQIITAKPITKVTEKVIVPTTSIDIIPTGIIDMPIPYVEKDCANGQGVVVNQKMSCEEQHGVFLSKFYPYPDCYSDFVCFLPPKGNEEIILSICIYIKGYQYCKSDITNIESCKPGSDTYDFRVCAKESSKLFENFKYDENPPLPTLFRPIPVTAPSVKPTTTTSAPTTLSSTSIEIIIPTEEPQPMPMPMPIKECALGKGVVMMQLIECNQRNGRFYKKFHPYPECYSDFVCFVPPEVSVSIENPTVTLVEKPKDMDLTSCILIDGAAYCSADITNVASCRIDRDTYNFKQCILDSKSIFSDFTYSPILPIMTHPVRPTLTSLPVIKPSPTEVIISTSAINESSLISMIEEPTELPIDPEDCLDGAGEVMMYYFECQEKYGLFLENFHPYPECYTDFVCFLPPTSNEEISLSTCIYSNGRQYCKSDITSSIDACEYGSEAYDFRACAKESSQIFKDFKYDVNPPLPTPFRPITSIPVTSSPIASITITKTSIVPIVNPFETKPITKVTTSSTTLPSITTTTTTVMKKLMKNLKVVGYLPLISIIIKIR